MGRQTGLQAVEPGTITPTAPYADHYDLTGTLSPTDTCNGGAGGGVSSVFARPDHQTAAGTRTTAGSVRAVPDTVADHDGSTGVDTPNAAILPPALAAAVKAAP